ncbi:mRNA surveillance protein pelota [Pycnococcus provasolii]
MKLVKKDIEQARADGVPVGGWVELVADVPEDMWQVYQLVAPGDVLRTLTVRNVKKDNGKSSGQDGAGRAKSTATERVTLPLSVKVEATEFDPDALELRCRGKVCAENEHVRVGSYHTLELELKRKFRIEKNEWDPLLLRRLEEACDPTKNADVAVLLVGEGTALVALVGGAVSTCRSRIEVALPRKRGAGALAGHERAVAKFYERCVESLARALDPPERWSDIRCLVIAGPGFHKEAVSSALDAACQDSTAGGALPAPLVTCLRSRRILATASSVAMRCVSDLLEDPVVAPRVADTKAAQDVAAMAKFQRCLSHNPERAFYGPGHVLAAVEAGAVETLLVLDEVVRPAKAGIAARMRWSRAVSDVEAAGGAALVFSSCHESGKQLAQLSGVAAVLRYPMPELEEEDDPQRLLREYAPELVTS